MIIGLYCTILAHCFDVMSHCSVGIHCNNAHILYIGFYVHIFMVTVSLICFVRMMWSWFLSSYELLRPFSCLQVDVMREERPSETVTTVDAKEIGLLGDGMKAEKPSETQLVRISENATMAENYLVTVETMDMKATGISDYIVKAGKPSVKVKNADKDTIGTSENAVLRKLLVCQIASTCNVK